MGLQLNDAAVLPGLWDTSHIWSVALQMLCEQIMGEGEVLARVANSSVYGPTPCWE